LPPGPCSGGTLRAERPGDPALPLLHGRVVARLRHVARVLSRASLGRRPLDARLIGSLALLADRRAVALAVASRRAGSSSRSRAARARTAAAATRPFEPTTGVLGSLLAVAAAGYLTFRLVSLRLRAIQLARRPSSESIAPLSRLSSERSAERACIPCVPVASSEPFADPLWNLLVWASASHSASPHSRDRLAAVQRGERSSPPADRVRRRLACPWPRSCCSSS
jgi:hypothetical protein